MAYTKYPKYRRAQAAKKATHTRRIMRRNRKVLAVARTLFILVIAFGLLAGYSYASTTDFNNMTISLGKVVK